MFISNRRGLKLIDILLVTVIGTIGGTYVWMPIFKENQQKKAEADKQQTTQETK